MSLIAALNTDELSASQHSSTTSNHAINNETQENNAYRDYHEALRLQLAGNEKASAKLLHSVLNSPLLKNFCSEKSSSLSRRLYFSCHKNLGCWLLRTGEFRDALHHLTAAVQVDSSDVTVLQRVGVAAYRDSQPLLARAALEMGLQQSPEHWPSLDALISVLYSLNDFEQCVLCVSSALDRNPRYIKGRVVLDRMLHIQPCLVEVMAPFLPSSSLLLSEKFVTDCRLSTSRNTAIAGVSNKPHADQKHQLNQRSDDISVTSSVCTASSMIDPANDSGATDIRTASSVTKSPSCFGDATTLTASSTMDPISGPEATNARISPTMKDLANDSPITDPVSCPEAPTIHTTPSTVDLVSAPSATTARAASSMMDTVSGPTTVSTCIPSSMMAPVVGPGVTSSMKEEQADDDTEATRSARLLVDRAHQLREEWLCTDQPLISSTSLSRPLQSASWLELAHSLLHQFRAVMQPNSQLTLSSPVALSGSISSQTVVEEKCDDQVSANHIASSDAIVSDDESKECSEADTKMNDTGSNPIDDKFEQTNIAALSDNSEPHGVSTDDTRGLQFNSSSGTDTQCDVRSFMVDSDNNSEKTQKKHVHWVVTNNDSSNHVLVNQASCNNVDEDERKGVLSPDDELNKAEIGLISDVDDQVCLPPDSSQSSIPQIRVGIEEEEEGERVVSDSVVISGQQDSIGISTELLSTRPPPLELEEGELVVSSDEDSSGDEDDKFAVSSPHSASEHSHQHETRSHMIPLAPSIESRSRDDETSSESITESLEEGEVRDLSPTPLSAVGRERFGRSSLDNDECVDTVTRIDRRVSDCVADDESCLDDSGDSESTESSSEASDEDTDGGSSSESTADRIINRIRAKHTVDLTSDSKLSFDACCKYDNSNERSADLSESGGCSRKTVAELRLDPVSGGTTAKSEQTSDVDVDEGGELAKTRQCSLQIKSRNEKSPKFLLNKSPTSVLSGVSANMDVKEIRKSLNVDMQSSIEDVCLSTRESLLDKSATSKLDLEMKKGLPANERSLVNHQQIDVVDYGDIHTIPKQDPEINHQHYQNDQFHDRSDSHHKREEVEQHGDIVKSEEERQAILGDGVGELIDYRKENQFNGQNELEQRSGNLLREDTDQCEESIGGQTETQCEVQCDRKGFGPECPLIQHKDALSEQGQHEDISCKQKQREHADLEQDQEQDGDNDEGDNVEAEEEITSEQELDEEVTTEQEQEEEVTTEQEQEEEATTEQEEEVTTEQEHEEDVATEKKSQVENDVSHEQQDESIFKHVRREDGNLNRVRQEGFTIDQELPQDITSYHGRQKDSSFPNETHNDGTVGEDEKKEKAVCEPLKTTPVQTRVSKRKRSILDKLKMWPRNDPADKRRGKRGRCSGGLQLPESGDQTLEDVNSIRATLNSLLPSQLVYDSSGDHSDSLNKQHSPTTTAKSSSTRSTPPLTDSTEREHVVQWLAEDRQGATIVVLIEELLATLAIKRELVWPDGLAALFVALFECVRPQLAYIDPWQVECSDGETSALSQLRRFVSIALMYAELKLDIDCVTVDNQCDLNSSQLYALDEHIDCLSWYMSHPDVFADNISSLQASLRYTWSRYKLSSLHGNTEETYAHLITARDLLQQLVEFGCGAAEVLRPNCHHEPVISMEMVVNRLDQLQLSTSLAHVQKLFDSGDYRRVIDLLASTDSSRCKSGAANSDVSLHRTKQLQLLVESLTALGDKYELFDHAERCLRESVSAYAAIDTARDMQEFALWETVVFQLLSVFDRVGDSTCCWLSYLPSTFSRSRAVDSLLQLCVHQLQNSSDKKQLQYGCDKKQLLVSWRLLHAAVKTIGETVPKQMPAHLTLLCQIHHCLGDRHCCSCDEGQLLLYTLHELLAALDVPDELEYETDLRSAIEQTCYCLYGHPSRRGRHLSDHEATPIELTWQRAATLYYFYCPCQLPSFDSQRVASLSADEHELFERIGELVPADLCAKQLAYTVSRWIDKTTAEGEEDDVDPEDNICDNQLIKPTSVTRNLYYLLADYRFKMKQWDGIEPQLTALPLYCADLVLNPRRCDSWAAQALVRAGQVSHMLNSCDTLVGVDCTALLWQRASAALRCYQRALDIDPDMHNVWLEYGTFSYTLRSHAGRLLKQESSCDLDLNTFQWLERTMLRHDASIARCLREAERLAVEDFEWRTDDKSGADDRWLHFYLMAKCSEKRDDTIEHTLELYQRSAELLQTAGAQCPRRVNYQNPGLLTLESLEVFYRRHVCILKLLMNPEEQLSDEKLVAIRGHLRLLADSGWSNSAELTAGKRSRDGADTNIPVEKRSKSETGDLSVTKITSSDCAVDDVNGRPLHEVCISALHSVLRHYPEHYKSLYRLAQFYFTSKQHRNVEYARDILMGRTDWQAYDHMPCAGLFSDRKPSNFFNGIWRIPIEDIDRPGSFAAHMYRSVSLLVPVLSEAGDVANLFSLSSRLKITPEPDKKYLRDDAREQLSDVAFAAAISCTRRRLRRTAKSASSTPTLDNELLLDIYTAYSQQHQQLSPAERNQLTQLLKLVFTAAASPTSSQKEDDAVDMGTVLDYCRTLQAQRSALKISRRMEKSGSTRRGRPVGSRGRHRWSRSSLTPTAPSITPVTSQTPSTPVPSPISSTVPRHITPVTTVTPIISTTSTKHITPVTPQTPDKSGSKQSPTVDNKIIQVNDRTVGSMNSVISAQSVAAVLTTMTTSHRKPVSKPAPVLSLRPSAPPRASASCHVTSDATAGLAGQLPDKATGEGKDRSVFGSSALGQHLKLLSRSGLIVTPLSDSQTQRKAVIKKVDKKSKLSARADFDSSFSTPAQKRTSAAAPDGSARAVTTSKLVDYSACKKVAPENELKKSDTGKLTGSSLLPKSCGSLNSTNAAKPQTLQSPHQTSTGATVSGSVIKTKPVKRLKSTVSSTPIPINSTDGESYVVPTVSPASSKHSPVQKSSTTTTTSNQVLSHARGASTMLANLSKIKAISIEATGKRTAQSAPSIRQMPPSAKSIPAPPRSSSLVARIGTSSSRAIPISSQSLQPQNVKLTKQDITPPARSQISPRPVVVPWRQHAPQMIPKTMTNPSVRHGSPISSLPSGNTAAEATKARDARETVRGVRRRRVNSAAVEQRRRLSALIPAGVTLTPIASTSQSSSPARLPMSSARGAMRGHNQVIPRLPASISVTAIPPPSSASSAPKPDHIAPD